MKSDKSLEQRLFHAYQHGYRLTLSADEVVSLVHDDAIATRITNAAAVEAKLDEPGGDSVGMPKRETWAEFKKRLKAECQ